VKLVYKSILVNTIVSIFILCLGEYSLYYFLKNKIEKETIEHLSFEAHIVKNDLKRGVSVEAFKHNIGDVLEIIPIKNIQYQIPVIKEVKLREEGEEHEEENEEGEEHNKQGHEELFTAKQVIFDVAQNERKYRISIIKAIDQDEGLAGNMSTIIFISGLFMLTILVSVNVMIYHQLFSPIYKLIKDIKGFSVQNQKKIVPPITSTVEFISLGEEISRMSEKMISDYASIKEFTENITHEIQTPLAVINSKLERCLQDENLSNEQAILLSDAAKSVNKLFSINKGLTLLSRLENKQFNNPVEINVTELIKERVRYFSDFIENKKLTVSETFSQEIIINMKESLSEILIDNLLKNAIQHNIQNGTILISTEHNKLYVSNTGAAPKESTEKYFARFLSQSPNQSLGLGLSIVKKIVEYYGYTITYNYQNDLHTIEINFNSKN
jgi:signal transduction histidine kinase